MRIRMTVLACAYIVVCGALLAIAHQPQGPAPDQKTDRIVGESAGSHFLVERFAG